jgi:hypothetical protein
MKIEEVRLDEKAFGGIGRKRRVASRSAKFAGQRRRMVDGGVVPAAERRRHPPCSAQL